MIGSAMSMMGYYLLLFILVVWMVVKIARSSPILAIATFFFWPASLIALIKNWGDRDHDIRIPFFAALLTAGLAVHMANRTVDKLFEEGAVYLTDEDLALIAEDDPELAQELRESRDEALASGEYAEIDWEEWEEIEEDDPLAEVAQQLRERQQQAKPNPALVVTRRKDRRAASPVRTLAEPGDELALQNEVSLLSYRFGGVEFVDAHALLQLPRGFRWAHRFALTRIAALRGTPIEPLSLGWVVHERVDLADPTAWYVELLWIESGHMALPPAGGDFASVLAPLAGQPLADGSGRSLGVDAYAPTWIADSGTLTWAVHDDPLSLDPGADLLAAKPLRHGVLLFVAHNLDEARHELGLRATRLLAASTRPDPNWSHADFQAGSDQQADQPLFDWVLGAPLSSLPPVVETAAAP